MRNETISIKKGKPIFKEGDIVNDIALVLKGKVDMFSLLENLTTKKNLNKEFKISSLAEGYIIGVQDLMIKGTYLNTYVAATDCVILLTNIDKKNELENYFNKETDYYTYSIATNARIIQYIRQISQKIYAINDELRNLNLYLTMSCTIYQEQYAFDKPINLSILKNGKKILDAINNAGVPLPKNIDYSYFCSDLIEYCTENTTGSELSNDMDVKYFEALAEVKMKGCKEFFGESPYIANVHLEKSANILNEVREEIISLVIKTIGLIESINCNDENNAYSEFVNHIARFQVEGEIPGKLLEIVEHARNIYEDIKVYFEQNLCIDITFGNTTFVDLYKTLFVNEMKKSALVNEIKEKENILQIVEHLRGSARKIVEYSEIDKVKGDLFLEAIENFRKLKDKFSLDSAAKDVRKVINNIFYHLYTKVYIKSKQQKKPLDRVIEMFLEFAYVDERLLETEQLTYLYNFDIKNINDNNNQIFSITKWIDTIFEDKRMPSINEFDLDYVDTLRELRKKRKYTDEEQKQYMNDVLGKVEYEIENMIKSTMKTCNGQILSFVPVLCKDSIYGDIERSTNTADKISGYIQDILKIDYSIFYREVLFYTQDGLIEREYVMKEVRPDIIIVPTFGTRVIAWQDISSRNRALPGRIVVPMFSGENFYELLIYALGQYRWDLCRSVMGVGWNNVQVKSLTSEYCDYLQFYKKNQALSELVKEKIKQQIASNRNINKEIFAEDYVSWMKYEVSGAVRLNKIVREMMVKYCTPSVEYRERLTQQNIFRDYILKWNMKTDKKVRELENKYAKVRTHNKGELPEALEKNLIFYRDL
jgi:hypothetical protein